MAEEKATLVNQPDGVRLALVVTESFSGYAKGDQIDDPKKITELLASEWSEYVIKIAK